MGIVKTACREGDWFGGNISAENSPIGIIQDLGAPFDELYWEIDRLPLPSG
jgi:hypothetical protein